MFYVIRVIFIAILVLSTIYLTRKGKQLQKQRAEQGYNTEIVVKKRHYVYCIIFFLVLFGIMNGSFYPFEKHFLTFSSEEAAFSYICKDSSDYERFENGNAIFYVDRDERTDTLYTITKIGDRYSYVDYEAESFEYYRHNYYMASPDGGESGIYSISGAGSDVNAIYSKEENITFYNVIVRDLQKPDEHTAMIDDNPLLFSGKTEMKNHLNIREEANCYYYYGEGEPLDSVTIQVENTCLVYNKRVVHKIL